MDHQSWVNRYRDELKGLAILWVVFFHSPLVLPGALDWVRKLGYGGVDIFFFLMGMGLYQSLQKQSELRAYAARRLWRILPAYLPVLILWMAIMYPGYELTTVQAIRGVAGNLSMTGYWLQTPKVFNWFANGQFFFLLIAPLFFAALTKTKHPAYMMFGLLTLMGVVGLSCIGTQQMMGVARLPIFLLGMALAMTWPISHRKGRVRAGYAVTMMAGLALVLLGIARYPDLLIDYGLYWYPFALITPGLCVSISYLLHKAERMRVMFAPLRWIGQASFEVYLLNIWMVEVAKQYALTGATLWALLCFCNVVVGIGYHWLVTYGVKALRQPKVDQTV